MSERNMSNVNIRRVKNGDAPKLAFVQTESWKAAFAEIITPELLEKCTDVSRAEKMYDRLINDNIGNGYVLEIDGSAQCIAFWDASREADMNSYAELICIHSLSSGWRRGYGSMMMDRVLEDISKAGYRKVMLWVFEKNLRAIGFYRKFGFEPNGRCKESLGAVEVMYEKEL